MISLDEIRSLPIAHTDKGDFFIHNGELTREFNVQGIVLRKRAGLVFIKIGSETFSFSSQLELQKDDCVKCIIRAEPLLPNKEKETTTAKKSLQTSQATFIIQSITHCA